MPVSEVVALDVVASGNYAMDHDPRAVMGVAGRANPNVIHPEQNQDGLGEGDRRRSGSISGRTRIVEPMLPKSVLSTGH